MLDAILELLMRWRWREILVTAVIVLFGWLGSRLFIHLLEKIGSKISKRTKSKIDDYLVAALRPAAHLFVLFAARVAVDRFQFGLRGLVDALIFVLGLSLVVLTLVRVTSALLNWYGEKLSIERHAEGETLAREMLPLAEKAIKVVILSVGLIIGFENFGIEVRSILVTLGVGSLAIGLALQDTLANMFGGFTIMIDRPFRIGDRIQLDSGELGDVLAIGIRSTRVINLEGNLLIIPNALLVKSRVTNHAFPDARSRMMVEVGISYDADPEAAKEIMVEAAVESSLVLKEPAPRAFFKAFGDSALLLTLICHATSYTNRLIVLDELNTKINTRFKDAGIGIPYPIRTVYLERDHS